MCIMCQLTYRRTRNRHSKYSRTRRSPANNTSANDNRRSNDVSSAIKNIGGDSVNSSCCFFSSCRRTLTKRLSRKRNTCSLIFFFFKFSFGDFSCITYSNRLFVRHRSGRDYCGNVTEQRFTRSARSSLWENHPVSLWRKRTIFFSTLKDAYRRYATR